MNALTADLLKLGEFCDSNHELLLDTYDSLIGKVVFMASNIFLDTM